VKRIKSPQGNSRAVYFRSLSLLLESGIPIDRALDTLAKGSPDPALTQASLDMSRALQRGVSLSQAMALCPSSFLPFHWEAVQLGERSGKLDSLLNRLSEQEERSLHLRMRLKAALHYPCLIGVLCLAFLLLAPPLLFGQLIPLLRSGSTSLPLLTQAFLALSLSLRDPRTWLTAGGGIFLMFRAFELWRSHPRHARILRNAMLKVPGLGPLIKSRALAEYARALAVQIEVGSEMRQAMHQAARCSQDIYLIQTMEKACQTLMGGQSLAKSLASLSYFPPTFLCIVESGEECGDLPRSLRRLAALYEDDLENQASTFAALVEPLAVAGMGVAAALTIIALVVPLIRLAEGLN
jgi:type IV pilus assembly protein PilC